MKKLFNYSLLVAILGLFSISESVAVTVSSSFSVSGTFESYDHPLSLSIKKSGKHIKVRPTHKSKWVKYNRMGKGLYDNCRGKSIEYRRNGDIIYRDSNRRIKTKLYRTQGRGHHSDYTRNGWDYNPSRDRARTNHWNRSYRNGWHHNRWGSNDRRSIKTHRKNAVKAIKGNWYADYFRERLKIKKSKDGVKVRRSDSRKWTYFEFDYYSNSFVDQRGNRLFLINDNELIWEDYRRGTQYFRR